MIAKVFKGTKTKYNSENQESEKVDGTDVDLQWEADEATIFKRYQAFYGSRIMTIWDVVKILSVLDKHFKDIELELIEKVILKEMSHEEHAN